MNVTNVTRKSQPTPEGKKISSAAGVPNIGMPSDEKETNPEIAPKYPCYSRYNLICDARGICINPIQGELLRSATRLFMIDGVWHSGSARIRYDLIEYFLPSGWDQILKQKHNPPEYLKEMMRTYNSKPLELSADVLEGMIMQSKLTWYWPGL